jgi:hypothetical protein
LWSDFHVHSKVQYRAVPGGVELKLIVQEMPVDLEPRFVGNVEEDLEQVYDGPALRSAPSCSCTKPHSCANA